MIVVHTPVHASWLNQAEIYFSIAQRKVLQPNDFADLDELEHALLAFGRRRADRQAVRVEVHPPQPRPRARPPRPHHRPIPRSPSGLTREYVKRPNVKELSSQRPQRRPSLTSNVA